MAVRARANAEPPAVAHAADGEAKARTRPGPRRRDPALSAPAVDEETARAALRYLDVHDVEDVLSPLQLGELLRLGGGGGSPTANSIAGAAARIAAQDLGRLLSPLQLGMLAERHTMARRSTMMCRNFFEVSDEGSVAAGGIRGAPMLPDFLRTRPTSGGGVLAVAERGGDRAPSPESESSTDDAATGGSRASSLCSWISDEGGNRAAHLSRSAIDLQNPMQVPTAPRYNSYRAMPSWEVMAARASERMTAAIAPNSKPIWDTLASSAGSGGGCGIGNAASTSAASSATSRPGTTTLFDRARAAQHARRRAAAPEPPRTAVTPPSAVTGHARAAAAARLTGPDAAAGGEQQKNVSKTSGSAANAASLASSSWAQRAEKARLQAAAARAAVEMVDEHAALTGGVSLREQQLLGSLAGRSLAPVTVPWTPSESPLY